MIEKKQYEKRSDNSNEIGEWLDDSEYRQHLLWCAMKTMIISLYLSATALCVWGGYYIWSKNKEEIKQCLHSMSSHIKNSIKDMERKFEKRQSK